MKSSEINRDRMVRIEKLKAFAHDRLPATVLARDLIITESDEISVNEFLIKSSIWLKLLKEMRE